METYKGFKSQNGHDKNLVNEFNELFKDYTANDILEYILESVFDDSDFLEVINYKKRKLEANQQHKNKHIIKARIGGLPAENYNFSVEIEQENNDNLEWESYENEDEAEARVKYINSLRTNNWNDI